MHAATLCLVLLGLVCCASLLARLIRVPLPFLQIAVGALAALPPFGLRFPLDPATFMLLFIPPLLFGDGWSLPGRELLRLRWAVLGHAVGLVLLTVLIGGIFLHWLVPAMPLSVGFAVAALVSPTDAVALSAITEHMRVPRRMMHLLESEALLNDASGLVAMRLAVAATMSGAFSPISAAGSFVVVAGAGLAIGWLLTLAYGWLHRRLFAFARDATVQTVLSGLLPFAAYELAEHFGASGVLAAVAAGMAASRISLLEHAHLTARMQAGFAWRVLSFSLNGIIFVLLGLQLPDILGHGPVGIDLLASASRLPVLGEIAALTGLLVLLRLAWVLVSLSLGRLTGQGEEQTSWRVILASSMAGVRGAVTLAGVLSLPLTLPNGTPFPARDLAVTLATGVILCSMLLAALALPLLLRHLRTDDAEHDAEQLAARIAALEAGIQALSAPPGPGSRERALIEFYRARLATLRGETEPGGDSIWRELHSNALHAERRAVHELRRSGKLDDGAARQILGELDLVEAAIIHRPFALPPANSAS